MQRDSLPEGAAQGGGRQMPTVLVVDDTPDNLALMAELLGERYRVKVANSGERALKAMQAEALPDLVLLDITMPKLDGLEVISRISALRLPIRILVLTSQAPQFYAMRCMKAGAAGYLCKTDDVGELRKAIAAVMHGYTFFPNLADSSVRRSDGQTSELELIQSLTDRELSILQQLSNGLSNKQIAEAMLLSSKTVSTYKTRLIEKLNVKSVVYLADFAKRNNLL